MLPFISAFSCFNQPCIMQRGSWQDRQTVPTQSHNMSCSNMHAFFRVIVFKQRGEVRNSDSNACVKRKGSELKMIRDGQIFRMSDHVTSFSGIFGPDILNACLILGLLFNELHGVISQKETCRNLRCENLRSDHVMACHIRCT